VVKRVASGNSVLVQSLPLQPNRHRRRPKMKMIGIVPETSRWTASPFSPGIWRSKMRQAGVSSRQSIQHSTCIETCQSVGS
jgi:hypothetical protein